MGPAADLIEWKLLFALFFVHRLHPQNHSEILVASPSPSLSLSLSITSPHQNSSPELASASAPRWAVCHFLLRQGHVPKMCNTPSLGTLYY